MPTKKCPLFPVVALAVVFTSLIFPTPLLAASKETVLYNFCSESGCADGANPLYGSLVADTAGNLYGTTYGGGANGFGAVFQLVAGSNGKWTENVLYSFTNEEGDGAYPVSNLILDSSGNLYGTTEGGGVSTLECGNLGCGTVFQLKPAKNGVWNETLLYEFCSAANCADGFFPEGGLIFDSAGNLYGTTFYGGNAIGTVFQLAPSKNGQWTENVLYNFCSVAGCLDGSNPSGSLIFDTAGNLYGTTQGGGTTGYGAAFQLSPAARGKWTESVLHNFGVGTDGVIPVAGLILDSAGNLYGTAGIGGIYGSGIVFELSLSNGEWTEKILHNFNGKDGSTVFGGLIFDSAGNLYGTTLYGGASGTGCGGSGCGTVFQLQPKTKDRWTERLLHSFKNNEKDGNNPYAGVILSNGNLYGVTNAGGQHDSGTVFEVVP